MTTDGSPEGQPTSTRSPPASQRPPASLRAPASMRPPAARRSPRRPAPPPRHPLVIPLAVVYAALLFSWSLLRYKHFGSTTYELGSYHSILWNVAFRGTPWNSLERAHQWSTHLELGLAALAPLYRIAPTPVWLWLAESVCCAAAALPIDALARRITGDRVVGLMAAAAMLLGPQMVLGQLADFHVLALCALPVAVMAWAVEVDSSRALTLGAAAAVALREQMGIVVAMAAVVWVVRHGKRRAPPAVALAVVAGAVSAIEIFLVIPAFGSGSSFHYVANYAQLGAGAGEVLETATSRPGSVMATMFEIGRARYLAELLTGAAPLAFLALRSLRRSAWPLLVAVPQIAIQLLSSSWHKWDVHYPYGMPAVPLVAAASVLALYFIPTSRWPEARRMAVSVWLSLSLLHLSGKMPSPVGPGKPLDPAFRGSARAAALAEAIAKVPQEASVSAQDDVVPHVAARSEIHRWPDGRMTDDYILLDMEGPAPNVRNRAALGQSVRLLRSDPRFEVVVDRAGVLLAKRVAQGSTPPPARVQ